MDERFKSFKDAMKFLKDESFVSVYVAAVADRYGDQPGAAAAVAGLQHLYG